MIEKHIVILLALPFVSVVMVTFVNLLHNPVGTMQGIQKFIIHLWGNMNE